MSLARRLVRVLVSCQLGHVLSSTSTNIKTDPGDEGVGTIWSTSLTALHEMLHWSELTVEVAQVEIEAMKITRPDTGQITVAYRSFYSMHMKDWSSNRRPTTNADNHVFTVAECFYSFLCPQLPAWEDPSDPVRIWAP